MAENLNYAVEGSKCYNNNEAKCTTYGRLYDWATAMGIDSKYNSQLWGGSDVKHKGICPVGWHLPSQEECQKIIDFAGSEISAGKLKATSGWEYYGNDNGNGADNFGFSALPGGSYSESRFFWVGDRGQWWGSSEYSDEDAYFYAMSNGQENVYSSLQAGKSVWESVRCVKD